MNRECLLPREGWLELAGDAGIVTSDNTLAEAARARPEVLEVERPRSDVIARLGWKKILLGETVSAEALEANYIRRSETELFAKGK